MGGLNHPDLATRAGEETLPQYDDSDLEHDDGELPTEESNYLVPIAKNAVDLAESNNGQSGEVNGTAMRPTRPKIDTHTIAPDANDPSRPVTTDLHHDASTLPLCDTSISATSVSRSSRSPPRSVPPGKASIEPPAISPLLRKYTIPSSERAPTETLPAMQNSPPASSSKSPNGVQKLPSLSQIQLEPAKLDARSPNEHHHGINRSPYPMNNGTVASPPIGSIAPRPGRYPSPRAPVMSNGAFPTYQYGQPSPATSDASPRDSNMSPPNKPPVQAFYSNRQTPRSEELTPQSAHSQESASSFSTAPSPQQMDRPILPPLAGLPNGPMMTGSFKCDHAGCAAAPFQTQYLLNSHANVHSQVRPHYCPVQGCNRGEGGKGFKRKNEMIRHGLVHESPGYICPFCPVREHKYPRPDNLQRHVRVNHIDKDTNDPQLREVLAQRCEGGNRGRRRRLGS